MRIKMRRFLSVLTMATALALPARAVWAESLNDALAAAYATNPTILGARAGQRATDERVPQALSGWRPTVTVNGGLSHDWVNSPGTAFDTDKQVNGQVSITLRQPVFNGFATVEGVKSAEATVRAGQQNLLATEQNTLFNAVQAYMDVYAGRQLVTLERENLGVLQAQLRAANERFNVGEITRTDVAQARASLSQAQASLANAQATLAADVARYLQIVGKEPGKLQYPKISRLPKSLKAALAQAGEINPSILAAAFVEEASRHDIEVAKAPLLPQIALEAGASASDDFTRDNTSVERASIGAVFSWQLYGGGQVYSSIRQAKQLASQKRIQVVEVARAVRQAVAASWNAYAAFGQIITAAKAQVSASQLALEGVRQEYQAGTRTTLDVLNAQAAVVTARTALVTAERNRVVAAYQLLAAIGQLTARDLGLKVATYDPTINYDAVRDKWIGTEVETLE
ncbi:MAG: TolC family outer membrane protein [Alphaproteobacteria bacterium]|nr:TolC family outer membrane protein [Alphaproteobacteria bacterium]